MFCKNCGELILENDNICPACGTEQDTINTSDNMVVVYASQKENEKTELVDPKNKAYSRYGKFELIFAVLSFIFLSFNYMSVSVNLLYGGSSDSSYTGYGLIECLGGTAWLSGLMSILLIVLNFITVLQAFSKIRGKITKKTNKINGFKNVLYIISTIVPLLHISYLLSEFDSSLTTTSVGLGCYLNIGVAIVLIAISQKQKNIGK